MAGAAAPAAAVEPGLIRDILANRVENVRKRLMNREDPDQTSLDGTPAILVAINENNTDIVHLLLHFGATIDYIDNNQNTLLHYAVQPPVKDRGIIEAIVRTANNVLYVQRTNSDGQAAYHAAAAFQTPTILYHLGRWGGNPTRLDNRGQSPIFIAAIHGNLPNVRFLHSEMLVDINVRDQHGRTPLHATAGNGYLDIVDYLLRARANANIPANDGSTPLHVAAENGHVGIVDSLLRAGANANIPDNEGRIPMQIATINRHHAVVRLLAWARRGKAVSAWAAARAAKAAAEDAAEEAEHNGPPAAALAHSAAPAAAAAPPRVGLPRENAVHPNIPGRRNQGRPRKTRRRR